MPSDLKKEEVALFSGCNLLDPVKVRLIRTFIAGQLLQLTETDAEAFVSLENRDLLHIIMSERRITKAETTGTELVARAWRKLERFYPMVM